MTTQSNTADIPVSEGPFHGTYVTLSRATRDNITTFWHHQNLPDGADDSYRWTLGYPPKTQDELWERLSPRPGAISFAVLADPSHLNPVPASTSTSTTSSHTEMVGAVTLMQYDPSAHTLEFGVMFSPILRRTVAATEAIYLLLRACFEPPGYKVPAWPRTELPHPLPEDFAAACRQPIHRVVWRHRSENNASRRAAGRFGFQLQGTMERARWSKGMWYSSVWWAMRNEQWPGWIKEGFEGWLAEENFDAEGRQKRTLEQVRGIGDDGQGMILCGDDDGLHDE